MKLYELLMLGGDTHIHIRMYVARDMERLIRVYIMYWIRLQNNMRQVR